MPFIPVFIGVIVLGLVIGAGISMLARRNEPQTVVAKAPSPQPTLAPVTPAPTEKPTSEPTVVPKKPAVTRAPAPEDAARLAPASARTPKATRTPLATHSPSLPQARSTPPAAAQPALAGAARPAAPAASARPVSALANAPAAAPATNAPLSADDADSDFAKLAAGVVRQYIAAVARGDVASAYGALGQNVPDNADLPEIGVIDGNTRIRHVEVHGSSEAAAVNVDMQGRSGLFFAQFTVHKTPSGAAVIVQHSLSK